MVHGLGAGGVSARLGIIQLGARSLFADSPFLQAHTRGASL